MKGSSTVGHRQPTARLWLEGCTWLRRGSGGVLGALGLNAKSQRKLGSGILINRWYLQMCHRLMRHGDERVEICWMGSFALLLIIYNMFVSPHLSLYISPFLVRFGCSYVPQFHEAYVLGSISSPQEFLVPGTWLLWWQAQRYRNRQVPAYTTSMRAPWWNFGEAWRSLANIGHHAKAEQKWLGKKGDQKREKATKWLRKGDRKRKKWSIPRAFCGTSNWRTHKPYSQEFPWHSPEFRRRSLTFTRVPVKVPSVWGWPSECAQSNEARKALLSVQQHASWNNSSWNVVGRCPQPQQHVFGNQASPFKFYSATCDSQLELAPPLLLATTLITKSCEITCRIWLEVG